mmetsp:Transcript_19636/g.28945  ORF Transcript_19636/g.28945 Transcript_19636/m.28945 type:complete len:147 (-) Transcript_19636:571-1011(-)
MTRPRKMKYHSTANRSKHRSSFYLCCLAILNSIHLAFSYVLRMCTKQRCYLFFSSFFFGRLIAKRITKNTIKMNAKDEKILVCVWVCVLSFGALKFRSSLVSTATPPVTTFFSFVTTFCSLGESFSGFRSTEQWINLSNKGYSSSM